MPFRIGNKLLLGGGLQLFGDGVVSRDLSIPYQDFFVAASAVPSLSGSVALYQVAATAASLPAMRFTGTKCSCSITIVKPVPQDAALSSGSGTVFIDWTDITTNSAVAVVGASLFLIPNGSAIGDTGTSTLGAAASGTTITGTSASELNSASLFQFNQPLTRSGFFALKVIVDSRDAGNTSGSDFALFGARIRYKSDRMGT